MVETTENKCSFAAEIVSYLYDEQAVNERNKFEFHLADCESCTDEFAGLSFARYSVFEWNKEEFVAIQTPRIVIPYENEKIGWFAGLREAISLNWIAPATVAAALLIVVGIALFGLGSETQEQSLIAANSPQIVTSPINPTPEIVNVPSLKKEETVMSTVVTKTRDTRAAKVTVPRNPRIQSIAVKSVNATQKPSRPSSIPEMTAEVEDDNSLRLADLFDTIDSK